MRALLVEVMRDAREMIKSRDNWTQKEPARDKRGRKVDPLSHRACAFCLVGCLYRAVSSRSIDTRDLTAMMLCNHILVACGQEPEDFNDTHTHADVLGLMDRVIAELSAPLPEDAP